MLKRLPSKELPDGARKSLAEDREFGTIPRRKLNIKWNDMVMALERGNYQAFIRFSEEVQGLIRIIIDSGFEKIKNRLKASRYCVAKEDREVDLASNILDRVMVRLDREGVSINGISVV